MSSIKEWSRADTHERYRACITALKINGRLKMNVPYGRGIVSMLDGKPACITVIIEEGRKLLTDNSGKPNVFSG